MIYLASPYSHPDPAVRDSRYKTACYTAGHLIHGGYHIYSPIVHGLPIAQMMNFPTSYDFWEKYCEDFIRASEKVFVLTISGWKESDGVTKEIHVARILGRPTEYIDPIT